MKAIRRTTPQSPLERELRRRKKQTVRLIAVAGSILVGSGAIIVPSVTHHREASEQLQSELGASADPLIRMSQVRAFEAESLSRMESAERLIETIAPDEPLPSDFRTRFRDRLVRLGLEVVSIEVEELVYLDDREGSVAEPPFIGTPVNIELKATTLQIETLVRDLANDSRPAIVTSLEIARPKKGLETVVAKMTVTFLHLNPSRDRGRVDDVVEGA